MNPKLLLSIALLIILIMTACGSASSGEGAAQAIEIYLTALVEKDADTLVNTSCAAWEEGALTDSRAYDGVTARLEGMACAADGSDGEFTLVSCSGNIIATYSGEDRPLPLDTRQYLALEEGGEWRMCGYR
jgi:hypothetical protein